MSYKWTNKWHNLPIALHKVWLIVRMACSHEKFQFIANSMREGIVGIFCMDMCYTLQNTHVSWIKSNYLHKYDELVTLLEFSYREITWNINYFFEQVGEKNCHPSKKIGFREKLLRNSIFPRFRSHVCLKFMQLY